VAGYLSPRLDDPGSGVEHPSPEGLRLLRISRARRSGVRCDHSQQSAHHHEKVEGPEAKPEPGASRIGGSAAGLEPLGRARIHAPIPSRARGTRVDGSGEGVHIRFQFQKSEPDPASRATRGRPLLEPPGLGIALPHLDRAMTVPGSSAR
jgi:hypothetical protein